MLGRLGLILMSVISLGGLVQAQRPDPGSFLLPPVVASNVRHGEPESPKMEPIAPVRAEVIPDSPKPILRRTELQSVQADEPKVEPKPSRPAARLKLKQAIRRVKAEIIDDEPSDSRDLTGKALFDYLEPSDRSRSGFGERLGGGLFKNKSWITSDHEHDNMISPVTNPFLFEDPRSVTELRPIAIFQKVPGDQPNFRGGELYFFGTQARIAFTKRISLTLNKIGVNINNPNGVTPFNDTDFGLSELWLGPKVTILRDTDYGTLLAAGAIFQIPLGSGRVFQDTGDLSITPYVTLAQPFLKTRLGTFNTLAAAGYSFSTGDQRSDYFYASGHVDYDIGNNHRFYPLAEVNWFQYTSDGGARFIKGEGRDLANIGGLGDGSSLLTGALGGRWKITRNVELGGAFEIPLVGNRDFFDYRFTVDLKWRY